MVQTFCFVPGCTTGYHSDRKRCKEEGKRVKTLFKAPSDEQLLRKWIVAVRRKDKILTSEGRLCEKHFSEDCIIRNFETKLPDGSVWNYERCSPKLKPGSIPTIFAHSPNTTVKKRKRKTPTARASMLSKKQEIPQMPIVPNHMYLENQEIAPTFIHSENQEIAPTFIHSENQEIAAIPIDSTHIQLENQEIARILFDPTHIHSENQEIDPVPSDTTHIYSENQEIAPIPIVPTHTHSEFQEIDSILIDPIHIHPENQEIPRTPSIPAHIHTENQEIARIPSVPVHMHAENQEITPIPFVSTFIHSENQEISSIPIVPTFIPSENEEIVQSHITSDNEEIAPLPIVPTFIPSDNEEITPLPIVPTFIHSENEEIAKIPVENLTKDKFLSYEAFLSELETVIKPNDLWAVSHNSNYIICAKWDSDCRCERHVIIFKDLSVKIFVRNKEIDVTIVKDIEDLSKLLMTVENLMIWENL